MSHRLDAISDTYVGCTCGWSGTYTGPTHTSWEALTQMYENHRVPPVDPLREAVKRYIASWEGLAMGDCAYPEELEEMVNRG